MEGNRWLDSIEGFRVNGVHFLNAVDPLPTGDNNRYAIVNYVNGRQDITMETRLEQVYEGDKSVTLGQNRMHNEVAIGFTLKNTDREELLKTLQRAKELFFKVKEDKKFIFEDEPYKEYTGRPHSFHITEDNYHIVQVEIIVIMSDASSIGVGDKDVTELRDIDTVNVKGTDKVKPIFRLTAKKKSTFAMVSKDDDYMLVGVPVDVDEEVVEERTLIMEEQGDTLSKWTTDGTHADGSNVVLNGSMVGDGTGVVVDKYGSGKGWHGPALMREVPPTQDFEIEAMVRGNTTNPRQTYRIEIYFYDEHMNTLGKTAIVDKSNTVIGFSGEGRYGPFDGPHIRYPISSKNYHKRRGHFHGMLRVKRIGNRFEFYIARTGQSTKGKHVETIRKVYVDNENKYGGRLKYVQMHMGKYGSNPLPGLSRINSLKVYRHNKVKVDQTPYIVHPGDEVVLDHESRTITINGEDYMVLKDFGADFFELDSGLNQIVLSPADTFEGTVEHGRRYL